MSNLVSSDVATSGLWRAIIVENISQGIYSVYIPALHRNEMPFKNIENPKEGLLEYDDKGIFTGASLHMTLKDYPKANSCVWQGQTPLSTGDAVWLMFENGDINYPIIMGQIGSTVTLYWNMANMISGSDSTNSVYTGDTISYIFDRLLEKQYSNAAICGILANMEKESGIRTNNLQDAYEKSLGYTDESYTTAVDNKSYSKESFTSDEAGYGLCQWTSPGRKQLLYANTVEKGLSISDITGQMSTLISELTSKSTLSDSLKAQPNTIDGARECAYIFCKQYEIPADTENTAQSRKSVADNYWNKYKHYTPTSMGTITSGELNWPTDIHTITSPYGTRVHPISGKTSFHNGIDIGAGMSNPVYAAESGTVQSCTPPSASGGYGNLIIINHASGIATLYAHLSTMSVSAGASVTRGQIIGTVGSTGNSTGPHLHFSVYPNGYNKGTVDPMAYLVKDK